jgi:hypothetical protein
MTTIGDTTFSMEYILKGSLNTFGFNYSREVHLLNGFNSSIVVKSLTLGKNLSCYGRIVSSINNQNLTTYQHFDSGSYNFETPITFLTFHLVSKVQGAKPP